MQSVALLIVVLQTLIWRPAWADLLLTVTPAASHYTTGESVTLTCSLSTGRTAEGFIFIKDGRQLGSFQAFGQQSKSYWLRLLSVKNTGRYSCKYWKISSDGRNFTFSGSNTVWISVPGSLPAPILSPDPQESLYLPGEQISLRCSAPNRTQGVQYQFFYHGEDRASERVPGQPGRDWMAITATRKTSGEYTCQYFDKESQGSHSSERSNPVFIPVIDLPPGPVLKVDPLSREVNEGDRLLLACSTRRNRSEKRFHFYRDGAEMTPSNEGLLWSAREPGAGSPEASVTIFHAKPNHTGEFACNYDEDVSGRWVSSPWSQKVNITVWAQNPHLRLGYSYTYLAIPLLVLLVALVSCWRRKKTASKRQQEPEPAENERETESGPLGELAAQTAASKVEASDVTYAAVRFCSAGISVGAAVENRPEAVPEEDLLYSTVVVQPIHRAALG